ncbi:OmpA family protein [Hyphomicrobium sp. 99]|uniref:OmpA family protein n=1 Tax=Hyphomicrobium sp. 99 TaxID=1163419 RepID=UPI0009E535AD|nr:OmpA family protein [Hyphomicrobium sp. 99]
MKSTRHAIMAAASLLAIVAVTPTLVRAEDQRPPPNGDNNGKDDNSKRRGKDDRGGRENGQQQPGQDRRERQGQQQDQQRPQRERPSKQFGGGDGPQGNPNPFGNQQPRNQQPPVVNNPIKVPHQQQQQQQAEPQPKQQPFNGKPKNFNEQFGGPSNDRNLPDKSKQFGGRDQAPNQGSNQPPNRPVGDNPGPGNDRNQPDRSKQFGGRDQAPNQGFNPPPNRPVVDNPGAGNDRNQPDKSKQFGRDQAPNPGFNAQPNRPIVDNPGAGNQPFGAPDRPLSAADAKRRFENMRGQRKEVKIDGGKGLVIEEPGNRRIIRENNRVVIQHDENERLRRVAPNARFEKGQGGTNVSIIERPGGVRIYSETDAHGQLLRRYRRGPDGRDVIIIDNRRRGGIGKGLATGIGIGIGVAAGAAILNSVLDVPPPRVRIPRDKYIVDYGRASDDDVYEALSAPPIDDFRDRYTLDEIRATVGIRDRMRRVDLDDITFEFGSWDVDPSQYRKLERIARGMNRIIDRNPNEVFMIEGYTDAVGSEEDNLSLSDRRAESVATVLSEQFQVPFENLTTQGYGEQYLKVPTQAPERLNRRVAVRRITPLLARDGGPPPPPPGGDRPYGDAPQGGYGPYDGPPPRDPRY